MSDRWAIANKECHEASGPTGITRRRFILGGGSATLGLALLVGPGARIASASPRLTEPRRRTYRSLLEAVDDPCLRCPAAEDHVAATMRFEAFYSKATADAQSMYNGILDYIENAAGTPFSTMRPSDRRATLHAWATLHPRETAPLSSTRGAQLNAAVGGLSLVALASCSSPTAVMAPARI